MLIDDALVRIRAYRLHKGWSVNKYAVEAGVAESTIRRLDDPTWSPTATTIRLLECLVPDDFISPKDTAA